MNTRSKTTGYIIATVSIAAIISSVVALSITPEIATGNPVEIKTVDGVAQYPKGYQGTPIRDSLEDPFLSPTNSALILIDYQPHILLGVNTMDHADLIHNTKGLIKTAVHFDIPIIFSHVGVGLNDSQPFLEELRELAPNAIIIDRTNVNAWEETEFVKAVDALDRKKLIMGGLWTDVCLAYPAIEATNAGYQVYVPEDIVGSFSQVSHENGMKRMLQEGVIPISWNVVPAELQRDHARSNTLGETTRIFLEYLFKTDPDQGWK